jgi:PKD repeat protein
MKNQFILFIAVFIGIFYAGDAFAQDVPEILYYKFDGSGTTIPNEASNPPAGTVTATIIGQTQGGNAGLCGGTLIGNGGSSTTNYVSTGWNTSLGNSPWTISFWTNDIPSTTALLYQFGDAGAGSFRCFNNGVAGAGNWMLRGPITDVICTGCAPVGNVPSMTTFVYDPILGNIKAYHNGVLNNTVAQGVLNINGTGFQVGGYSGSTGMGAGQLMDEFRFYDRALDAQEVFDTYNACLPIWDLPNDAGVASINAPVTFCGDTNDVVVTIKNYGNNQIDSCIVQWEVDGNIQTPYFYYGTLDTAGGIGLQTAQITLGSYIFAPFTPYSITTWTEFPNGVMDTIYENDTSTIVTQSALSGNFTIGALGDYTDFTSAVADINNYGVCGPIVFDIESGIYNEQITINEIAGASEINTITFQSLNQDPALVTLTYPSTGTTDNFVINMYGGDFVTFKEITIANTGTAYGRAILIQNDASVNQWLDNIITGDTNIATTSTNMALVYSDASTDSSNVFDGNLFENGSYSIYYYGSGTTSLENGTVIRNNIFNNFYYRGVHLYYQNDMEVSGNTFVPNNLYTGSIYRMYLNSANGALRVNNNKMEGNKYGYGIYMINCSGLALDKAYIYNNFIHVGDSVSTSTSYGMYITGCNNQVVANNSINMESLGASSRALYVTGGSNNDILNNILRNNGPGYGYYYNSGISSSENNNVYVPNGSPFYFGGAIPNLATWQITTGFDLASSEEDPMFVSSDDLHTCQELSINAGALPIGIILMDIDGQVRDANTPDIGADEFLGLSNLAFPEDSIWKCANDTVVLGGWEPTDGATYLWSTNDTTPTISITAAGTYSVVVTTTCGTDTIGDVEVMNIPDAVANFTVVNSFMTAICTNNSTGADSYLWDFGDGTTSTYMNPSHLYGDTGTYTVTLTVTGPCGTDVMTQTVMSSVVGLEAIPAMTALEVYPNPNRGEFTIDFALNEANEVSLELINMQGQEVWNSSLGMINGKHSENASVKGLASGIYLLKITVGTHSIVDKIIIE